MSPADLIAARLGDLRRMPFRTLHSEDLAKVLERRGVLGPYLGTPIREIRPVDCPHCGGVGVVRVRWSGRRVRAIDSRCTNCGRSYFGSPYTAWAP